ncbi:hypothetical protein [Flavobacterium sp. KACC 22763]|uniref:hypothetical protein n=1 Tax=Flavobacterium sp. KACC 22763 TaxID=3025668 RepID=UPI002366EC08|nr:hypothetical protein [Flavobacterium sp. KACC 22763]WDF63951.1 hypothetical protein PQ463_20300 [Flavobacterium sp. KACC 22763]
MKKTILFLLSIVIFYSCSNDEKIDDNPTVEIPNVEIPTKPEPVPQSKIIYIAGYEGREARAWKNSQSFNIDNPYKNIPPRNIDAGSIFVQGEDIYVFGSADLDLYNNVYLNYASIIWKNGKAIKQGSVSSMCATYNYYPLFITEKDFYYVSNEDNFHKDSSVPYLVKNDIQTALTDPNALEHTFASSMYVKSNDVYVVLNHLESNYLNNYSVKLWKNGQTSPITDGKVLRADSRANSIYVSDNNDVYIAGYHTADVSERKKAVIWKNGIPTFLTDGYQVAEAKSIYINGTDIYAAGYHIYHAAIWKNGVEISLTNEKNYSVANSIAVDGTDIYVVGYEIINSISVAMLWKNGVAIPLTDGSKDSQAKSIFIGK